MFKKTALLNLQGAIRRLRALPALRGQGGLR